MLITQCAYKDLNVTLVTKTATYDSHEGKDAETNIVPTFREMKITYCTHMKITLNRILQ
jgi:hypothetical protein